MSSFKTLVLLGLTTINAAPLTGNETCESTDQITHFDWDILMGEADEKPYMSYSLDIDQPTLSLIVDVELEYVGLAYADDHTYGFGTTYVLDFEDYDAESDDIREPGNCQNRMSEHFGGDFASLWTYSHTPSEEHHLANESTLSYPPQSEFWDLTIDDDCTPIKYHGEFSWAELRDCGNYDDSIQYTVINTDENWINLTGVFYINLVSPLAHYTDTGYYRVYQMLSAPFVIAVRSQVNLISSVGINLFTLTIIAVYKEDLETDFRLILLTEAADFLMLEGPTLLDSPSNNGLSALNFQILNESLNEGCLTASANLCSQLWEIYANEVTCPPTNFTGDYALEFTTTCNPDAAYTNGTELCNNYIATYGSDVGLTAHLEWLDEICDPEVFIIEFDGTFGFYTDASWGTELGAGDQYSLGETAYVQITIEMPSDAYDIFEVDLQNVWVCTTSPDNEPLTVDSQQLGTGGCLGANIDDGFPWHIVVSGEERDDTNGGNVTLYTPYQNGTMRFSFFVDSSIARVNLYVQAQVTINLVEGGERRRMRALLQSGADPATASQTRHFDGKAGINPSPVVLVEEEGDDNEYAPEQNPEDVPTWITIGVCVGIANICLISICGFMYFFKRKGSNKTQEIVNIMAAMQQQNTGKKEGVDIVVYGNQTGNGVQKVPQTPVSPCSEMTTPASHGSPVRDESVTNTQNGYPSTR